ncbi:MAG: hypothetical protein DRQ57_14610 [Gammaproteobacteria bacterium]|nr:MAG: hypothetical protein DRQ57_14610 [Gammaproteobacteria bacterium]
MKKTQKVKKSTTQTSTGSHRINHSKQRSYGLFTHTAIAAGFILCQEVEDEEQGKRYLEGIF